MLPPQLRTEAAQQLIRRKLSDINPNWVDLRKASCDPSNLGGSEESFCRSSLNWVDRKKLSAMVYAFLWMEKTLLYFFIFGLLLPTLLMRYWVGYMPGQRSPPTIAPNNLPTSLIDKGTSMPVSLLTKVV